MYWYKFSPYKWLIGVTMLAVITSCRPEVKEPTSSLKYFDLKGYFKADSARLTVKQPTITKTVAYTGSLQTKKLKVDNWGREFEPFINSDINRPAWRGSYKITTSGSTTIYTAQQPELKTRRILISQANGKVKWILIYNHSRNLLYENIEKLTYFPDSLYQIDKTQHIRLFKQHTYMIKDEF